MMLGRGVRSCNNSCLAIIMHFIDRIIPCFLFRTELFLRIFCAIKFIGEAGSEISENSRDSSQRDRAEERETFRREGPRTKGVSDDVKRVVRSLEDTHQRLT